MENSYGSASGNIQCIFNELDDKYDIFNYIQDINIENNYIAYKESNEYGTSCCVYTKEGIEKLNILYDSLKRISSFYFDKSLGLHEKIYSNRTEYYINGCFYSCEIDFNIQKIQDNINSNMYKYPTLYSFIMNDDTNICFIDKNEIKYII